MIILSVILKYAESIPFREVRPFSTSWGSMYEWNISVFKLFVLDSNTWYHIMSVKILKKLHTKKYKGTWLAIPLLLSKK